MALGWGRGVAIREPSEYLSHFSLVFQMTSFAFVQAAFYTENDLFLLSVR